MDLLSTHHHNFHAFHYVLQLALRQWPEDYNWEAGRDISASHSRSSFCDYYFLVTFFCLFPVLLFVVIRNVENTEKTVPKPEKNPTMSRNSHSIVFRLPGLEAIFPNVLPLFSSWKQKAQALPGAQCSNRPSRLDSSPWDDHRRRPASKFRSIERLHKRVPNPHIFNS